MRDCNISDCKRRLQQLNVSSANAVIYHCYFRWIKETTKSHFLVIISFKLLIKKSLETYFPRKQTLIPCRRIGRAEGGEGVREVVKDWEDSNVEPTRTITGTTLASASGKP